MEILSQLQNNPFVWFVTVLCALVSIYLGKKSIERKTIKVILESNEIITNQQSTISKVSILFDDNFVDKLTITKLTFWNNTSPTINNTDIIEAAPFSIFAKNGKILEISILKGENTSNRINITQIDDISANIIFDYLDKKEGGIIQIIHTGDSDSIDVTRKIKGGKVKLLNFSNSFYRNSRYIILICYFLTVMLALLSEKLSSLILLLFTIPLIIVILIDNYKDIYKNYIPKNCKEKILHEFLSSRKHNSPN